MAAITPTFYTIHDPQSLLDYTIDWTEWLATSTDTIQVSLWLLSTSLTNNNNSHDNTTATVWISGGTAGEVYDATNQILTVQGRQDRRSIQLTCVSR